MDGFDEGSVEEDGQGRRRLSLDLFSPDSVIAIPEMMTGSSIGGCFERSDECGEQVWLSSWLVCILSNNQLISPTHHMLHLAAEYLQCGVYSTQQY